MDGKGYIYLENQAFSTVNLPHSTITQTSCNFSPLLTLEFVLKKVFVDVWLPWKNPSVKYSQWYIKNECSDVA